MDSLFDNIVVDLLSGGSGEGHIKMTSSSSFLFSFGKTVSLICGKEVN